MVSGEQESVQVCETMTPQTDDALVREVLTDRAALPREKELAKRLVRLLNALDDSDEMLEGATIVVGRRH